MRRPRQNFKLGIKCAALRLLVMAALPLSPDASFTDQMSDLGSDADASRGPAEPAVKRERIEISHPLQEM